MLKAFLALAASLSFFTLPQAFAGSGKIMIVDAYDPSYSWSKSVVEGAKRVIGGKAEVKVLSMDTKRNPDEDFKKAAGERAFAEIQAWGPDVVIACDDNASKYLLAPFMKDGKTPCVFCGVNWDASVYGFPCSNVTGMVEVSMVKPLFEQLRKLSKGSRIGHLGRDDETTKAEFEWYERKLKCQTDKRAVKSFDEWKREYLKLQDSVDIIFLESSGGIEGWNEAEARDFVMNNTRVPTGSSLDFMSKLALITFAKDATEQGEWSASAALRILNGEKPSSIQPSANSKAIVFLNVELGNRLGIKFPMELLKASTMVK